MRSRVCLLVAFALLAVLMPSSASAAGAYNDFECEPSRSKPEPIVLVHATFFPSELNWPYMSRQLAAAGWCVFALDYGERNGVFATDRIERSAAQLDRYVTRVRRATGARRVKLVGHSQGGMMPRYYLRFLGGAREADELVALSPSNHGTRTAEGAIFEACPACAQQATNSSFLRKLNRGREVEPGVDYTVLQTNKDQTIVPYRSSFLEGARSQLTNVLVQRACPASDVSHGGMAFDPMVLRWVLNALRRDGPASPRFRPACG